MNLPRFEFPCNLLFCCDDIVEGPMQLTHWLLPCVAQQLASDYIWAMHQIIAQTVAWAIDFPSKSLLSWQRGCEISSVEALPISQ